VLLDDDKAFLKQVLPGPRHRARARHRWTGLIAYGRAQTRSLTRHRDIARALDGHQPIPAKPQGPLSQLHIRVLPGGWTSAAPLRTCWPSSSPPWPPNRSRRPGRTWSSAYAGLDPHHQATDRDDRAYRSFRTALTAMAAECARDQNGGSRAVAAASEYDAA